MDNYLQNENYVLTLILFQTWITNFPFWNTKGDLEISFMSVGIFCPLTCRHWLKVAYILLWWELFNHTMIWLEYSWSYEPLFFCFCFYKTEDFPQKNDETWVSK